MTTENFPATGRLAQLCGGIYDDLRAHIYAAAAQGGFPDLRPSHSAVLRNLGPDGARVVELAERAGITKQSMAYLTDGLARAGYIEIGPDPDDGRAKRVRLSARGREAVALLTRLSEEAEAALADQLGAARFEMLRAGLRDVRGALDAGVLAA